jgi:hypothetical protein
MNSYFMHFFINKLIYLFYGLVIIPFVYIIKNIDFSENFSLILMHVFIGIISIAIIIRKDCGMMTQAAGVFFLLFFSLSPINELNNEIIYWEGEFFNDKIRFLGVSTTFLFVFFFWLALNIKSFPSDKGNPLTRRLFNLKAISSKKVKWLLLSLVSGLLLLLYFYEMNLQALFFKGGEPSEQLNVDSKILYLFIEYFLRPMLFNLGLVYVLFGKKVLYRVFLILIIFFVASPTGISRFLVAALYMPLIIVMFMGQHKKNQIVLSHNTYLYPSILLFGLLYIFPLLDIFRYFSFEKFINFSFFSHHNDGSFDAYQMYLRALDVGSVNYGYGFLGAILFFIPRFFWPSKPVTSGIEISQLSNLRLENVSMPIIGEFYLNFWFFGVILGGILLALLFKKIDLYYLRYKFSNLSLGHLVYFQLATLIMINMRGGFLSSFAYTCSILMTWILLALFFCSKSSHKY